MAVRAAYLSNNKFFILSGKFMLLFYPFQFNKGRSFRMQYPGRGSPVHKKEELYGGKQRV